MVLVTQVAQVVQATLLRVKPKEKVLEKETEAEVKKKLKSHTKINQN